MKTKRQQKREAVRASLAQRSARRTVQAITKRGSLITQKDIDAWATARALKEEQKRDKNKHR